MFTQSFENKIIRAAEAIENPNGDEFGLDAEEELAKKIPDRSQRAYEKISYTIGNT